MNYVNHKSIKEIIKDALHEDIGKADITTQTIVPSGLKAEAVIIAEEDLIICGLAVAQLVFRMLDRQIKFKPKFRDGDSVKKGRVIAQIKGRARSILSAERVALNFLALLSGVSTATMAYVKAVRPYKARILDTRKTLPGIRLLEKYAVRMGGGFNHRLALDEMVLVKDNHLKAIGGYPRLTGLENIGRKFQVELEAGNLKEFRQALNLKPDIIMLDNMSVEDIKKAVRLRNKSRIKLEASGRVSLKNVKKIAATGVDMISIGCLTHSVKSVDISLELGDGSP